MPTARRQERTVVIKLGGSLVVPEDIAVDYVQRFAALVRKHASAGLRFILIVGGGCTNRWYRDAAMAAGIENAADLHWLGIRATQLNAEFVRALFGPLAYPRPLTDPDTTPRWNEPVLVVGGFAPGYSTDNVAVLMAERFGADTVINVSDVEALYTADPKKDRAATPIAEIAWDEYRKMFGNPERHLPGQNIPIDAVAAINSQRLNLETFFVGGRDLENLDNLLTGKKWTGTRIYQTQTR
ncbi:MAG: UMP kinase [bacterium]|nr:UMP kinase [bacterium]MDZ4296119.1 UMP kinase [Patescibacteria group bacterium]